MGGLLYNDDPGGLLHFVLITLLIGGVLAWQAGRAIASTWRPFWIVPVYMVVLAAAVQFLHYALGGEDLLSLQFYISAFVLLCLASAFGYRSRRSEQMSTQYSWLFSRSGQLGWSMRT